MIVVFLKLLLYIKLSDTAVPALWGSDGGLYGYYAKQILLGHISGFALEYIPGYLLVLITKLFGISLDKAIYFSPIFLSSLCVFPVIIIGHTYKILRFAFFTSIIGSITYGYYTRSFLGYYDTDILNLFFTLSIVAFMILTVEKKEIRYLYICLVFIFSFFLWYHSSKLIIFVMIANFILYILVWQYRYIFERKKIIFLLFLLFFIVFLLNTDEINSFFIRAYDYIFKRQSIYLLQENSAKLIFKSTLSTVSEAKALPLQKLGKYLSINNFYLAISLMALILFYMKFRSFLLTFSLLSISLLSLKSGIRFSEYGVYIVAFGSVYVVYIVKNILLTLKLNKHIVNILFYILLLYLSSLYLKTILKRNASLHPIFSTESVKLLHNFDKRLKKDDYILTWWDYGWPLWYYTKANTLVDNGKHFEDNYIISKLLFSTQSYSAKASKYLMRKCQGRRCYLSRTIFKKHSPAEVDRYIEEYKPKKIDKNIYFFFHERMVKIIKVILSFSAIDPQTGAKKRDKIIKTAKIKSFNDGIYFGINNKIRLDLKRGLLLSKKSKIALHDINLVNRHIIKIDTKFHKSKFHVIVYKNRYMILCNDKAYKTFFIQVFLLERYDRRYFELVGKSDEIKILKVL